MDILHFVAGQPPRSLSTLPERVDDGLLWLDIDRRKTADWATTVEPWLKVEIDPRHVADSLNAVHPSFFDGTPAYDMLVFAGLGPGDDPFPVEIRAAAFFLFDRALVTIHDSDSPSFGQARARLAEGRHRNLKAPLDLTHLILDTMVDRFLAIRDPMDLHFNRLQDELLDLDNGQNDWRLLLQCRREARRLEALCSDQVEALDAFRRGTRKGWTSTQNVRMRDLTEHIDRVLAHTGNQERDIEAALQLHFALATERTNRIVRSLTALSAVFFPLTLITGIYGMNFEHMPELSWRYGYFAVLGLLVGLGAGLLLWLRRRRYF